MVKSRDRHAHAAARFSTITSSHSRPKNGHTAVCAARAGAGFPFIAG